MSPIANTCGRFVRIRDPGAIRADSSAVRAAADRAQDQVVELRLGGGLIALEPHADAVGRRLCLRGPGLQHHAVEALTVVLLPDLHQVAISAGHQAVGHLDHLQPGAERRIHGAHLQADDAAADHEHPLRAGAQQQRAGRVDHTWIIGQERQSDRLTARRDDRLLEADHLTPAAAHLPRALGDLDLDMMRVEKAPVAPHHPHLARLGHASEPAGQFADHLVLPAAQCVEIDARLAEHDPMGRHVTRLVDHRCGVQQRLRWDAADVQAHAAEGGIALQEHRIHAQVGRPEGRRIASGTGADHQHRAGCIGRAGERRCRSRYARASRSTGAVGWDGRLGRRCVAGRGRGAGRGGRSGHRWPA
jgi:hypothetical protein